MSDLRGRMGWLHTWAGLLLGWLMFAIFVTGTASYFRYEISQWMRPELRAAAPVQDASIRSAVEALQTLAPDASRWQIEPASGRDPVIQTYAWWDDGRRPNFKHWTLDPATGAPAAHRPTMGGEFLYYFHFTLRLPGSWGYWTVCAITMAMLVTLVSGIITHRRIFTDFFTFRPGVKPRAWLDAHNVLGVLALPFHLAISITGVVAILFVYLPWGMQTAYPKDRGAFFAELIDTPIPPPAAGDPAPLAPVVRIAEEASRLLNGQAIGRLSVYRPGREGSIVEAAVDGSAQLSEPIRRLRFDHHGTPLASSPEPGPAAVTRGVLHGLHNAVFAGTLLRWLMFLSGAMGSAMIATGLVLWAAKRRIIDVDGRPIRTIVDLLNIGAIAGLLQAIACYFLANRLLPIDLDGRLDAEIRVFFTSWILTFVWAALRPLRAGWVEILALAAIGFAAIPIVNGVTTERGLVASLSRGDGVFIGFDLAMLTTAAALGLIAARVARTRTKTEAPHA